MPFKQSDPFYQQPDIGGELGVRSTTKLGARKNFKNPWKIENSPQKIKITQKKQKKWNFKNLQTKISSAKTHLQPQKNV